MKTQLPWLRNQTPACFQDAVLTLPRAANFRQLLRLRLAQLAFTGVVPVLGDEAIAGFTNLLLSKLALEGYLRRHELDVIPVGIGDGSWWATVAAAARRKFGPMSEISRRSIHLAVGSALRLALLEGHSYEGYLRDQLSPERGAWAKGEAIAYAWRFSPGVAWDRMLGKVVTTSSGDMGSSRWQEVAAALESGAVSFVVLTRLRAVRSSYDSYVNPRLTLTPPWESPEVEKEAHRVARAA